jgi:hypothetical protein
MGCGCLLVLLLSAGPRLALAALWLLTPRVTNAFSNNLVPLLGFAFLPFTTLMYTLAWGAVDGVSGLGWALVCLGFFLDLGAYGVQAVAARVGA